MVSVNKTLGGGLPGSQPKGGLIGGGGGPRGGSGMIGSNQRGKNRMILRFAFGNNAYRLTNNIQQYPLRNLQINADGSQSTFSPMTTPFRIAMNAGDIYGTINKPANKLLLPPPSNQITCSKCLVNGWKLAAGSVHTIVDGSAYVGNPKFVYSGEDYIRYRKLKAINKNYNDLSFGGNDSNAQQQILRFIRHG